MTKVFFFFFCCSVDVVHATSFIVVVDITVVVIVVVVVVLLLLCSYCPIVTAVSVPCEQLASHWRSRNDKPSGYCFSCLRSHCCLVAAVLNVVVVVVYVAIIVRFDCSGTVRYLKDCE